MNNIILLFSFLITLFCIPSYAQEKPKAKLIDVHGTIGCDDTLARHDALIAELQKNPESQGYIIIQVDDKTVDFGLKYELWVKGNSRFRGFDESRITVIRSTSDKDFKVTYWSVPKDAELLKFTTTKWDLTFPQNKKPYIFSTNRLYDFICPGLGELNLNIFSEYFSANPNARSNIVIKSPTKRAFRKEKQRLKTVFSDDYKISIKRLRFFYVKKRNVNLPDYSEIEVWILP